jgi:hypothetical protein
VTLTGQVTVTDPDGAVQPYAGQEVDLDGDPSVGPTVVTTDADGSYRGTVTIDDAYDETADAWVPETSTVAFGMSPSIFFTTQVNPVRITASVSPSTIMWEQQTTLSGTVTYQATGGGWVPLAGYTVFINSSSSTETTAVTNAAGQFSVPADRRPGHRLHSQHGMVGPAPERNRRRPGNPAYRHLDHGLHRQRRPGRRSQRPGMPSGHR